MWSDAMSGDPARIKVMSGECAWVGLGLLSVRDQASGRLASGTQYLRHSFCVHPQQQLLFAQSRSRECFRGRVRSCAKLSMDAKPANAQNNEPASPRSSNSGYEGELEQYGMATKLIKGGHAPHLWTTDEYGRSVVNPPVYHASTVTFPTMKALRYASSDWPFTGLWYGRHGQPTSWALEEAFAVIEGGHNACAVGSGVAAANASILAFVEAGDHVLMTDAVYDPTRSFCDKFLKRFGVDVTYYSPATPVDNLRSLFKPGKTKVLFCESPASLSFEVQDLPALCELAHELGAKVIVDNTYGPTLYQPLALGADVSYNAATKYIGGHSDIMLGLIACTEQTYRPVKLSVAMLGCPPGPDDCYLALRGLRTLGVRLRQHEKNALEVANWLETRPEVARVIHPGLQSHPQHELFKRDFSGSNGLFTFQLKAEFAQDAVDRFIDGLALFSIGFSWGGFESLIMPCNINSARSVDTFQYDDHTYGKTLRLHIGLEDTADLIKDLTAAFERLKDGRKPYLAVSCPKSLLFPLHSSSPFSTLARCSLVSSTALGVRLHACCASRHIVLAYGIRCIKIGRQLAHAHAQPHNALHFDCIDRKDAVLHVAEHHLHGVRFWISRRETQTRKRTASLCWLVRIRHLLLAVFLIHVATCTDRLACIADSTTGRTHCPLLTLTLALKTLPSVLLRPLVLASSMAFAGRRSKRSRRRQVLTLVL
ncbi:putative cystathionine beta-lyase [Porphyridium purpureum]|uniref:Putative cystathionine beta-lyase n=1 Tax=Porphyridium purpureum TaxID=35688 RepID=A0A5J4Z805_PORPP|nr:putative cystathionine beta-lyase [Porphyridium purpureum]|eukprot:POR5761..scf295_1